MKDVLQGRMKSDPYLCGKYKIRRPMSTTIREEREFEKKK
jgi:hypothetical protein